VHPTLWVKLCRASSGCVGCLQYSLGLIGVMINVNLTDQARHTRLSHASYRGTQDLEAVRNDTLQT
jgi:hypothetical protein